MSGYFSWHASTGIWLLVGALFLSATGITWSTHGGANVDTLEVVDHTDFADFALAAKLTRRGIDTPMGLLGISLVGSVVIVDTIVTATRSCVAR